MLYSTFTYTKRDLHYYIWTHQPGPKFHIKIQGQNSTQEIDFDTDQNFIHIFFLKKENLIEFVSADVAECESRKMQMEQCYNKSTWA